MQITIEDTKLEELIKHAVEEAFNSAFNQAVDKAIHKAINQEIKVLLYEIAESKIPAVSDEEQAEIEAEIGESPEERDIVRTFTLIRK